MKKKYLFLFMALISIVASCDKDKIISNDKNVGISKVAYYPKIVLTGNTIIAIPAGSVFTEPGVKATVGGADVPVVTSGSVNTTQVGVYKLTYTATNADGSSVATRTVVVYSTDDAAGQQDLSGKYLRPANGVISTWVKVGPGVYTVQNPGGAASGASLVVIALNPTGVTITIPDQEASDGSESSSSNETYTASNPATYSWVFNNPGYGTNLRTFVKQ